MLESLKSFRGVLGEGVCRVELRERFRKKDVVDEVFL